jgi:hypothetical protein
MPPLPLLLSVFSFGVQQPKDKAAPPSALARRRANEPFDPAVAVQIVLSINGSGRPLIGSDCRTSSSALSSTIGHVPLLWPPVVGRRSEPNQTLVCLCSIAASVWLDRPEPFPPTISFFFFPTFFQNKRVGQGLQP